ncbi:hypothetical protein QTP70_018858 [Hemibagrus guttatus]|uniref:Uncharacterized protein n=1 Tax=Hemibagrus guttatus TaxID=175788 RepID=A0AAE0PQ69_9TELE|nr:hypothetical protein QTP70_018858 [Hemibagrus guttatus]
MNFFGAFSTAALPLRPLLLAAGAAAATTGLYAYVTRSENTEGPVTEVVKEQITKLVVSKVQLQNRVRELEELLCQARRDCDLKSKEREQEREAHSILLAEKEEMLKTLTHKAELLKTNQKMEDLFNEREQEREAHSILQMENYEMKKTMTQLRRRTLR